MVSLARAVLEIPDGDGVLARWLYSPASGHGGSRDQVGVRMTANPSMPCPRCGAPAHGPYCSQCGLPLGNRPCGACGTLLSPSARFCSQCGASTAPRQTHPAAPPALLATRAPWLLTGIVTVIAIAAVVYATGAREKPSAPETVLATGTPPDLSKLTLKEQFDRLNDRVTRAAEQGDSTTAVTFWPMAAAAYQNLPPGDRDVDTRFHMAWLHYLVAEYPEALALADTIMRESPDNLFGFYLRATIAKAQGDSARAQSSRAAFRAHFDAEVKKTDRQEYIDHRAMLDQFQNAH
jgi:hypothetical protein